MQIIRNCWIPGQFVLRKVKSHQDLSTIPPQVHRVDAIGNHWAEARLADNDQVHKLFQAAQTWQHDQLLQTKKILAYLADLNLQHALAKQQTSTQAKAADHHDSTQDWGTLYCQREKYQISHPPCTFCPDIHPKIIAACLWGNQYADLVRQLCASLIWPDPNQSDHSPLIREGITWHELTIAFIVNPGVQFPTFIKLKEGQRARPHHWQDPKVLALPKHKRSLREQSEEFRIIALYLQGFTTSPLLPKHSKTGSTSLTRVGWGRTYTGGFELRPQIPQARAVNQTHRISRT